MNHNTKIDRIDLSIWYLDSQIEHQKSAQSEGLIFVVWRRCNI